MSIKKVEVYETDDGKQFNTLQYAENYQKRLEAIKYFNDNMLYGDSDGEDIIDFIDNHLDAIKAYVN
jgi:hypothetical protein